MGYSFNACSDRLWYCVCVLSGRKPHRLCSVTCLTSMLYLLACLVHQVTCQIRMWTKYRDMLSFYTSHTFLQACKRCSKTIVCFCQPSHRNIPPTLHALEQHVKRSVYQAGYVWGQCLLAVLEVPSPDLRGWKKSPHFGLFFPKRLSLSRITKVWMQKKMYKPL